MPVLAELLLAKNHTCISNGLASWNSGSKSLAVMTLRSWSSVPKMTRVHVQNTLIFCKRRYLFNLSQIINQCKTKQILLNGLLNQPGLDESSNGRSIVEKLWPMNCSFAFSRTSYKVQTGNKQFNKQLRTWQILEEKAKNGYTNRIFHIRWLEIKN